MNPDEWKGLRLRRTQLRAELARIEALLGNEDPPSRIIDSREDFYRDAENDFRNADSNGNYE